MCWRAWASCFAFSLCSGGDTATASNARTTAVLNSTIVQLLEEVCRQSDSTEALVRVAMDGWQAEGNTLDGARRVGGKGRKEREGTRARALGTTERARGEKEGTRACRNTRI